MGADFLVFPSTLEASVRFAEEARRWGRSTLGASSVEADPNADRFDDWARLPFIGDPGFLVGLGALLRSRDCTRIFTPHAPTFHFLSGELERAGIRAELVGDGPFNSEMNRIGSALAAADLGLEVIRDFSLGGVLPPREFVAGLLRQAEIVHGECSQAKILALCAAAAAAPRGDVVEIGALFGKSGYVLNRLAVHYGLGATLCVDAWDLHCSIQRDAPALIQSASGGWRWDVVFEGFLVNMCANSAPPFNYMRATSADAVQLYSRQASVASPEFGQTEIAGVIALLHLDGNHDERAVREDYELWSRHLAPGGWVVFDDYAWPHGTGPRTVADEVTQTRRADIARTFLAGGALFIQFRG